MIITRYAASLPPTWANDPIEEEPAMIHAPSHLIRAGKGRIKVLRLAFVGNHCYPLRYTVRPGEEMCAHCGCTNRYGCPEGCGWVDLAHTVCSRCFKRSMLP